MTIVTTELSDESSDGEENDEYLWESFVMSCNRGGHSIFEWLEGIIKRYKWSEKDDLFQKQMKQETRC